MATSYERLVEFIEQKYSGSIKNFAETIGIHPNTITSYKSKNMDLPAKFRDEVEKAGLSWKWYKTGEGAMFSEAESRKGDNWEVHEAYEMVIQNINDLTVNEVMELYNRVKPIGEAFESV